MKDTTIYSICLIVFMLIMAINGIRLNKRISKAGDYITGGRSIGILLGAGMFVATFLSSSSIVGQVGFVHNVGWSGYSSILGTVISMFLVGYFLVSKIREQGEYGQETIPDFFESRYYSKFLRGFASIFIVLLYVIFVAVEVMGLAKTLEALLGWNYHLSVIVTTVVTLLYITVGGLLAVAYNDSICALIGVGGTLFVMILSMGRLGGFEAINLQLYEMDPNLVYTVSSQSGIPFIISMAAIWGIGNSSHPAFLGQAYGAKSKISIMKSLLISSIFVSLFYFATQILGGASRVMFPDIADYDHAFLYLIKQLLNPIGAGILVASIMALVISTTDTVLLTAGTAFGNDFIVKTLGREVSDRQRLTIVRIGVILVGIVGMIIALTKPAHVLIFQMLNFGAAGAVFFVPIMAGFYWKRATKEGGIASMVGGLSSYILWYIIGSPLGLHAVIIGVIVSVLLMVVISLATPEPPIEVQKQYFSKNIVTMEEK